MRLIFFLITILFARDNPFEAIVHPENVIIKPPNYFHNKKVFLPSDARVLKNVVFVYQNLDGDIKNKKVVINKDIDFHSPLVLSHSPKEFGAIYVNFPFFNLYIKDKLVLIKTRDMLLRKMFLLKPFRLVFDFRRDANFLTFKRVIKNSIVKKVIVGNHDGYYRVVLVFDARYIFKITNSKDGVKIELR